MELNKILKSLHTSCKDCLFADYEGNKQIGCKADLFSKFETNGGKIVPTYDNEKEFFVVLGRKCPYVRDKKWGENYLEEDWGDVVRIESKIQYDVIIYIPRDFIPEDMPHLKCILNDLIEQEPLPGQIIVCEHFSKARDYEIVTTMEKLIGGRDIKWLFQRIVDGEIKTKYQAVAQAIPKLDSLYFSVFNVNARVDTQHFFSLNKAVFTDMKRFSILTEDEKGNGFTTSSKLYNLITSSPEFKEFCQTNICKNPYLDFVRKHLNQNASMICSYDDFCGKYNVKIV
jgi:hypothetical protein